MWYVVKCEISATLRPRRGHNVAQKAITCSFVGRYSRDMAYKRIHVSLSPAQFKLLEKLQAKLGLDTTNTIRYCVARIAEQENLLHERLGKPGGV